MFGEVPEGKLGHGGQQKGDEDPHLGM